LGTRHGGGSKPRLSAAQEAEAADWIRRGPDLAADGIVRWRCTDIQARIADRFGAALHARSVGKLLHRLRFARLSTRPRRPKADAAVQASFRLHSAPS
jgi:transposase